MGISTQNSHVEGIDRDGIKLLKRILKKLVGGISNLIGPICSSKWGPLLGSLSIIWGVRLPYTSNAANFLTA